MNSVRDRFEAAEALSGVGEASHDAKLRAYEEAEAEYFRKEAYAECIDEQEEMAMQKRRTSTTSSAQPQEAST